MSGHIFVSYARADATYVRRLVTFLARAGVDVWMDDEIATGQRWEQVLRERIESCASLLVVMTPPAAASAWVAIEVRYARELGRPILALLLEGEPIFDLAGVQFEDVTDASMPSPASVARLRGLTAQRLVVHHQVGLVPEAADCYQHRDVADELEAALAVSGTAILIGGRAQILSGLGGVGKTQLGAWFARRMRDGGLLHVLAWINASSQDAIVSGYAGAAAEIVGADPSDPAAAADALLRWLATTTSRWLIVLDDLTDPRDLDGRWPPRSPTGRVVVTTRRRDAALGSHGALLDVGVFSAAESRSYLSAKFADRPERLAEADELAQDLGHLPLALAQAATFIIERDLTCAAYRAAFADRQRTLTELATYALPDDYTRPVAVTLSLSIEVANQLDPVGVARPLLAVLALLDSNGVPADLIATPAVLAYLGQHRDPVPDPRPLTTQDAKDGLICLSRLNLVDISDEGAWRGVAVHTLVQRAVRDQIRGAALDAAVDAAAGALLAAWPRPEGNVGLGQAAAGQRAGVESTRRKPTVAHRRS